MDAASEGPRLLRTSQVDAANETEVAAIDRVLRGRGSVLQAAQLTNRASHVRG